MIDQPRENKPALTVVIQSWWTPVLALVMLVVGLLGGYFGRPLLTKSTSGDGDVTLVTTPTAGTPVAQATRQSSGDPTYDAITTQQEFMDYVISHTTNFKGDPDALVTIIEFSDYQ